MVLENYDAPRRALIGHTGFVGSNLDHPGRFTARFNSGSIDAIEGRHFDEIVCAGVSAKKWLANKEPDADWEAIARLIRRLQTVTAQRLVLISTIDVYPDPAAPADEDFDPAQEPNHPYGRHRLMLEHWARSHFSEVLVVRLPALFGPNLAKNALFDLLHGKMLEAINPASVFQWYPVERLWRDIGIAREARLGLVNLFTEPVSMGEVVERFFPGAAVGPAREPAPRYGLRTRHAALYGESGPWMMDRDAVFEAMARFIASARSQGA